MLTDAFADIVFALSPEEALILIGLAGAAAGLGKAAAHGLRGPEGRRVPVRVRPDRRPPGGAPDGRKQPPEDPNA